MTLRLYLTPRKSVSRAVTNNFDSQRHLQKLTGQSNVRLASLEYTWEWCISIRGNDPWIRKTISLNTSSSEGTVSVKNKLILSYPWNGSFETKIRAFKICCCFGKKALQKTKYRAAGQSMFGDTGDATAFLTMYEAAEETCTAAALRQAEYEAFVRDWSEHQLKDVS